MDEVHLPYCAAMEFALGTSLGWVQKSSLPVFWSVFHLIMTLFQIEFED